VQCSEFALEKPLSVGALRLYSSSLSLANDTNFVPALHKAANIVAGANGGHAGSEEVAVREAHDAKGVSGALGILSKETELVPNLKHEESVIVGTLEINNLLLEWCEFVRRVINARLGHVLAFAAFFDTGTGELLSKEFWAVCGVRKRVRWIRA